MGIIRFWPNNGDIGNGHENRGGTRGTVTVRLASYLNWSWQSPYEHQTPGVSGGADR
jgi:hypothetical protein